MKKNMKKQDIQKGEQGKRYVDWGSHYGGNKKSGSREIPRDLQGWVVWESSCMLCIFLLTMVIKEGVSVNHLTE